MSKDELTEEDVMKYLEECNESQDIFGFCYIPEIVCSKILDLYQKEKEKNSKAIAHIKACRTNSENYILFPSEIEYLLELLKENNNEM